MIPSTVVQAQFKKVFEAMAKERPLLQQLHAISMVELSKDVPDLVEVTAGIIQSSGRIVSLTQELMMKLLEEIPVEELQPQLDYVFTGCVDNKNEELISTLEPELATIIRSHIEFNGRLSQELTETFGPGAMEKGLKKAKTLDAFVDSLANLPGFQDAAQQAAKETEELAVELAPAVAKGVMGEII